MSRSSIDYILLLVTLLLLLLCCYCQFVWTISTLKIITSCDYNYCVNGDCIKREKDGEQGMYCKCKPCWYGSNCNHFDDPNEPYFKEIIINLYLNVKEIINHFNDDDNNNDFKMIFQAKALDDDDDDDSNRCNDDFNNNNCSCIHKEYRIIEQRQQQQSVQIFEIDSKNGQIFIEKSKFFQYFNYDDRNDDMNDFNKNFEIKIFVWNPNTNLSLIVPNDKQILTINVFIQNQYDRFKRQAESESESESKIGSNNNGEDGLDEINGLHFGLRTIGGETASLQVGNSIHYKLEIGLPPKASQELIMEIQTLDSPMSNRTSLSLYNFSMPYETNDIQFNIPEPRFHLSNRTANVYDRLTLDFGIVRNNGQERNVMTICFSVVLFRKPRKAKKKHSIIVGNELTKGSLTYVAESEITTVSVAAKDDQIFCDVDILNEPKSIALDSLAMFSFDANLQFRSDPVRIVLNKTSYEYEPDNRISLGLISVTKFGSNYMAMPTSLHHYKGYRNLSDSHKSYTESTLNMNMITNNGEKSRVFTKNPNNSIGFSFAIYALNFKENIGRNISIQLDIFISKRSYYTRLFNVTIVDRNDNERIQSFMLESKTNFTQTQLIKGSLTQLKIRTTFQKMQTNENIFTNYSISMDMNQLPFIPCAARLLMDEAGINIPYVDPTNIKPEKLDENKYQFDFGRINFIHLSDQFESSDSELVAEITFRLPFDNTVQTGNISVQSEQIQIRSGFDTKPLLIENNELMTISFDDQNMNETSSSLTMIELSTNSSVKWADLIVDGGLAIDIDLEFEPNAVFEDFQIKIGPDSTTAVDKLPDLRICRFAVITVAETMPCISVEREMINEKQIFYGHSKSARINQKMSNTIVRYNDQARIDFGSISVMSGANVKQKILTNFAVMISEIGSSSNKDNNVVNNEQQEQSKKQYPIRIDIISNKNKNSKMNNMNGENVLKTEIINLNISESLPETIVSDMSIELDVELFDKTDSLVLPGFTTNILIRILTKANTMGPLRIEVNGGNNNNDDDLNGERTNSSAISICGLWIHRIGYNLPCVENDRKAEYSFESIGINKRAILQLDMITNFGNHRRKSEQDERNDNSIEFMAMIRMLENAAENSNQTITVKVIYGHKHMIAIKTISIPVGTKSTIDDDMIMEISKKKLSEPRKVTLKPFNGDHFVHNRRPKLFYFDIELDANKQTKLSIAMERSTSYKICNAAFIKIGKNYPCYSPSSLAVKPNQFDLGMICHTNLYSYKSTMNDSTKNEENLLRLAFALLPLTSDSLTSFTVSSTVLFGYDQRPMNIRNELTLNIVNDKQNKNSSNHKEKNISGNFPITQGASVIPITTFDEQNEYAEGIGFKIRQKKWIKFKIKIPVYSTGKLSVQIRGQTDNNRAYIVLYDLRLISGGTNIPCPLDNQPNILLKSTININQTNMIMADFGWFANFGYTYYIDVDSHKHDDDNTINNVSMENQSNNNKNNNHNDDDADVLTMEVLAELTDHPSLNENDVYRLEFETHYGNSSQTIKTNAHINIRLLSEREEPNPKLDVNLRYRKRMPTLDRNETFTVMATIKHLSDSNAEPNEPVLRMFTPEFVEISNINWANTKTLPKLKRLSDGSTDILFPWILFNEEFTINFTIQIDPRNIRGYGRDEVSIITPYRMMCKHFRVMNDLRFPCSRMKHINYRSHSSECNNRLGMSDTKLIKDDQIVASSAVSAKYAPHYARFNSQSWWSPVWRHWNSKNNNKFDEEIYIQIDFRQKTRLIRIEFKSLKNQRFIDRYHLDYSFDGKIWYRGSNSTKISYNNNNINDNDNNTQAIGDSWLKSPIESRLIRLIIESVSYPISSQQQQHRSMKQQKFHESQTTKEDIQNNQYVAVKFELYGCYIHELESSTPPASNESLKFETHFTDDNRTMNRHISIDPYTNIVYFCDATININNHLCYYSDSGGNSWQIIGRSIDSFEGFELATGKFFAIDYERPSYFYSVDRQTWIPIGGKQFADAIKHPKFQHKTIVPRLQMNDLNKMNIRIGNWRVNYRGLTYEDNQYPKALWNKCCGFE